MHRDLKLANILLTDTNPEKADVKLADFGFARILQNEDIAKSQLGTPLFMAPEIFNKAPYDFKIDVWSLGVVVYEILTGRPLFQCRSLHELRQMQKHPTIAANARISPYARQFLERML